MTTIAVVAMGQMGAAVAARLVSGGARVLTSMAGRSAASLARAQKGGIEVVSDEELVDQAEIFLSIVPPANAGEVADKYRALIKTRKSPMVYVECNAIATETLQEIAKGFAADNLPFVDGSILGAPPRENYAGPNLYLCGEGAAEITETVTKYGITARDMQRPLGDASTLKMAYAAFTKGIQALAAATAVAAARQGVSEDLIAEMKQTQPAIYGWLQFMMPAMYDKAYRWDGEMREIAKFMRPEPGSMMMFEGAAEFYTHLAQENRMGAESEFIGMIDKFLDRTSSQARPAKP